ISMPYSLRQVRLFPISLCKITAADCLQLFLGPVVSVSDPPEHSQASNADYNSQTEDNLPFFLVHKYSSVKSACSILCYYRPFPTNGQSIRSPWPSCWILPRKALSPSFPLPCTPAGTYSEHSADAWSRCRSYSASVL